MAGGLGCHFAYREFNQSIYVCPARLRYTSILFLNILTLLARTQSADNLFHSFTVLCENEYVLISSLHCLFCYCNSMSSGPSLFLDCENNISVNIFIPIQYFKHLNVVIRHKHQLP